MPRLPSNSRLKSPGSLPLHLYQANHSFLQAFWAHRLFHRITRQPKMQAVCVHLDQLVITPVYKLVQTVLKELQGPRFCHLIHDDSHMKRLVGHHFALSELYFVYVAISCTSWIHANRRSFIKTLLSLV